MTNKSIVLCDVDGVLAQFDLAIINKVNPLITSQQILDLGNWDIFQLFNEEENKVCNKILEDPQFWRDIPVLEAGQKAIEKLRQKDFEVVFLTSPWLSCKEWVDVRYKWLKKYFDGNRDNIIITNRKDLVFGDVFIDDKLENITKWNERWSKWDKCAILCETLSNSKNDWHSKIITRNNKWELIEKEENSNG